MGGCRYCIKGQLSSDPLPADDDWGSVWYFVPDSQAGGAKAIEGSNAWVQHPSTLDGITIIPVTLKSVVINTVAISL